MQKLSRYDFLELVAFTSKINHEGRDYAEEHYPPEFESPDLADANLTDLINAYGPGIDAFWDEDDAVDQINAHTAEADKRERERLARRA